MSPLWTLFNLTLLTLLVTEDVVHSYDRDYDYYNEYKDCDSGTGRLQRRPTITAIGARSRNIEDQRLYSTYGEDIAILCSSRGDSNLTILEGKSQLPAKRLNSTTVQVTLIKPDVGEYMYHCNVSINCISFLMVTVEPAMSVTAPRVLHSLNQLGKSTYFVPRDEVGNVFCSANFVKNASISLYDPYGFHKLQTAAVNDTTVMATMMNVTEGEEYRINCEGAALSSELWIIKDIYPEVKDFKCVLYQIQEVECWWKSSSKRNIIKLFVIHEQGSTQVCLDRSRGTTSGCKSLLDQELLSIFQYSFSFQLQTCYLAFFCSNQTYDMDSKSITKVAPVHDLILINTSSRSAAVAWHHKCDWFGNCAYKMEYRLLGTDWRPANVSSSVRCEYDYDFNDEACELHLPLPCPDAHYELRIYARHEKATDDILYWSKPTSLFFFTARSMVGEMDPACGVDFREPDPTSSARFVLHEVRKLISDERKEQKALRKHITDMYKKVAEIKALLDVNN